MDQNSLFTSCGTAIPWPEPIQAESIQAEPSENAPIRTSVSSQTYNQTPIGKKNPPSCTSCRRKKVKCDRAKPCSRCIRVGTMCVSLPPSGLPRGRKGGRRKLGSTLLDRILELENLVSDIERERSGETTAAPPPDNGTHAVRCLDSFSR